MKIRTFLVILILFSQFGFCQDNHIYIKGNCKIINGKTANCGDTKNKNGYWIHYKVGITSHTDFVNDPSQYSGEETYLYLNSEGNYLNNSKIGKWIKYSDYKSYEKQYIENISFYDNLSKKDSLELEFFIESTIRSKTFWSHGVKDSIIVFQHNGQIKFSALFIDNKIQECWIYYINGQLKYYIDGVINKKVERLKCYDAEGHEIEIKEKDISMIAILEDISQYID